MHRRAVFESSRRLRLRGWAFVLASATALSSVAVAGAAEAETEPTIAIGAPASCTELSALRARLIRLALASKAREPIRSISIRIADKGERFVGAVRLEQGQDHTIERTIEASECSDVTSALELVTAIALGLDVARAEAVAAPPPPPAREPVAAPADSAAVRPAPRRDFRVLGSVHAGVVGAVGPELAFAPGVGIGVGHDAPGIFAPEIELIGTRATSSSIVTPVGTGNLTLLHAGLAARPFRFAFGDKVALRPAGELQVGTLQGRAEGALVKRNASNELWIAAALLSRVDWDVERFLILHAELGAVVPISRSRYFFTPSTPVYEVPALAAIARVGGTFAWP